MADTEVATPTKAKRTKKARPKSSKPVGDEEEIPLADMNTTSKFDQLLQQAVGQATEGAKSKKKKKTKKTDESVLESLRKGEGLQKDEDAAIKANTYDPGNSPKNEKSNKQKQKLKETEGKDNEGFEILDETKKTKKKKKKDDSGLTSPKEKSVTILELDPSAPVKKKKKKKKPPDTEDEIAATEEEPPTPTKTKKKKKKAADEDRPMSPESEPASPKPAKRKKKKKTDEQDEEERPLSPPESEPTSPKAGKKKKKKKGQETEEEEGAMSPAETGSPKPEKKKKKKAKKETEEEEAMISPPMSDEEQATPSKGKKKKKKKKKEEDEVQDAEAEDADADDEETEAKEAKKVKKKAPVVIEETEEHRLEREAIEDEGQILAVTVHRTDKLKNDFHILHPMVRVHIVNEETGLNLTKQKKDRAVSTYFETQNDNVTQIVPIMTQPFDFKERKSVLPVWEELLVFNENFNYFTQDYPKVIVFFELLDFVSMSTASRQYEDSKSEGGWHRIAWGFLKVKGMNDKLNVGSKVRLQLFEPVYKFRPKPDQVELWQWWKTQGRRPYPSTLYVTMKGITPPDTVEPAMRSMFATQREVGSRTYADLKKSINWSDARDTDRKTLSSWSRLVGQMCRIPNQMKLTLPAGRKGCYVVKFSHDGRNLACACHDRENYPILVYEIPSGQLLGKFRGHFGIVYDLSWSKKDDYICSASSDGTVRVWSLENFNTSEKLLPHPGFVYTAQFHPRVDNIIATGGYDQVVRIWDVDVDSVHGQLKQEIENHRGHVNSLCFDDDGQKMYTADSVGIVLIWNVYVTEKVSQKGFLRDWIKYQELTDPEMKDVPINYIQLHHSGRRLLVHCRDNIIRMVDLRIQRVMQKYIGALNFREQIRSSITPCGSFVFSGSEDNYAYAWNTDTGDQVAMYSELNYRHPVTDIDYHPRDHMYAACSLGDNQPIVVYDYDPYVAQMDAGLTPRQIKPDPKEEFDTMPITTLGTSTMKPGDTLTSTVLNKDQFEAHSTARLQKVMKKLNSATSQMLSGPLDLPGVPVSSPRLAHTGFLSLDQSMTPRTMTTGPQAFSPHAPRTMTSIMQQQQFSSQKMYMKSSDSDWRPGFHEVGRSGARSSSPTFIGRPPQIALTAQGNKAQFSFQAPAGKAVPGYGVVKALYDYRAQRSDELTIFKNDVITVLYKDNESWWMGELPDGQQGFFPANYVLAEDGNDQLFDTLPSPDRSKGKKKVTAVTTKSGELKFLSGTEESDEDILEGRKKGKNGKKKKRGSQDNVMSDTASVDSKASKGSRGSRNGTNKPPIIPNESTA
ncbi:jouberin-like isoform X4 [Mizuhopecten yessoensis]|uniref:Jouberin n=1 Tax=Mizuhopecten yessoensis TaxID=6573 RepID=A0A210QJT0_MIZYE|nr:jouberin-like isoform X4 [Mizuhopecten yessoensis]OWF48871.1 Jouberin [Mizuhopecten yessoensis]